MKKHKDALLILFIVLGIAFPHFLVAQYLQNDSLHVGIKSVVMVRHTFLPNGDSTIVKFSQSEYDTQGRMTAYMMPRLKDTTYYRYAEKGDLKTVKTFTVGEENSALVKSFDKNGRCVREEYNHDGKVEQEITYSYTTEGKLLFKYFLRSNGKKTVEEKRTYDKQGQLISTVTYFEGGALIQDSIVYTYAGKIRTGKIYDRYGILQQSVSYDNHDSVLTQFVYHPAEKKMGANGVYLQPTYIMDSLVITRDTMSNKQKTLLMQRKSIAPLKYVETFTQEMYENGLMVQSFKVSQNDTIRLERYTYNAHRQLVTYKKSLPSKKTGYEEMELYSYNFRGDLIECRFYKKGKLSFSNVYEIQYY